MEEFKNAVNAVPVDVTQNVDVWSGRMKPSQVSGLNVTAEDEEAVQYSLFVAIMSGRSKSSILRLII